MTPKQIKATAGQVRQLLDDVTRVPSTVLGDHLTDGQFVAASMDPPELERDVLAQVEQHLASCSECSDRMEHLLTVSEAWRGPAGEQRLAEVSQRIRDQFVAATPTVTDVVASAVARLAEWLGQLPQRSAALGAVAGASFEAESPGRSEYLSIDEDDEGSLFIRISSYDCSLAGTRVTVEPFGQTLTLEQVLPDQVGGEIVISSSARRKLAPRAVMGLTVEGSKSNRR
jgi:hypothetical protein